MGSAYDRARVESKGPKVGAIHDESEDGYYARAVAMRILMRVQTDSREKEPVGSMRIFTEEILKLIKEIRRECAR